jgi:murein DD-endopeptidase MepM/ murein hydrolase activator NlpD
MDAKPFFVSLLFILLLVILVGGAIGQTDLTPDTPPATTGNQPVPVGGQALMAVQGNGVCGSVYTVQAGDTLFKIAKACGLKVDDLLTANPSITDPNLIHAGQQIVVGSSTGFTSAGPTELPPVPTVPPSTSTDSAAFWSAPTAAAPMPQGNAAEAAAPTTASPAAAPSAQPSAGQNRPGGTAEVDVSGLPADTAVKIGIGRVGSVPMMLDTGTTDAAGRYQGKIAIPDFARPSDQWVVTVLTNTKPQVKVTAEPFTIE